MAVVGRCVRHAQECPCECDLYFAEAADRYVIAYVDDVGMRNATPEADGAGSRLRAGG